MGDRQQAVIDALQQVSSGRDKHRPASSPKKARIPSSSSPSPAQPLASPARQQVAGAKGTPGPKEGPGGASESKDARPRKSPAPAEGKRSRSRERAAVAKEPQGVKELMKSGPGLHNHDRQVELSQARQEFKQAFPHHPLVAPSLVRTPASGLPVDVPVARGRPPGRVQPQVPIISRGEGLPSLNPRPPSSLPGIISRGEGLPSIPARPPATAPNRVVSGGLSGGRTSPMTSTSLPRSGEARPSNAASTQLPRASPSVSSVQAASSQRAGPESKEGGSREGVAATSSAQRQGAASPAPRKENGEAGRVAAPERQHSSGKGREAKEGEGKGEEAKPGEVKGAEGKSREGKGLEGGRNTPTPSEPPQESIPGQRLLKMIHQGTIFLPSTVPKSRPRGRGPFSGGRAGGGPSKLHRGGIDPKFSRPLGGLGVPRRSNRPPSQAGQGGFGAPSNVQSAFEPPPPLVPPPHMLGGGVLPPALLGAGRGGPHTLQSLLQMVAMLPPAQRQLGNMLMPPGGWRPPGVMGSNPNIRPPPPGVMGGNASIRPPPYNYQAPQMRPGQQMIPQRSAPLPANGGYHPPQQPNYASRPGLPLPRGSLYVGPGRPRISLQQVRESASAAPKPAPSAPQGVAPAARGGPPPSSPSHPSHQLPERAASARSEELPPPSPPPPASLSAPPAPQGEARKPYPKRLPVVCNENKGVYIVDRQIICCLCEQCKAEAAARGLPELELTPTDFERHSGLTTAKKWKCSVKVLVKGEHGTKPGMNVGTWLLKNAPDAHKVRVTSVRNHSNMMGDVAPVAKAPLERNPKRSRKTPDTMQQRQGSEDTPIAGITAAGMTSPSGKKWLEADSARHQVDLPPAVMRDGGDFQARIPERIAARPGGREADHPCAGLPGPNTLEALAIAAGMEKESSDRMPIDAVADPEYHPGQVHDVRFLSVERGQRSRRKPRWLKNTLDTSKGFNASQVTDSDSGEEDGADIQPLRWGSKPAPKRKGFAALEGMERKRVRTVGPGNDSRSLAPRQSSMGLPRVLQWQVLNDGFMRMTVEVQGQRFAGVLMPQTREREMEVAESPQSQAMADSDSESAEYVGSQARGESLPSTGWGYNNDRPVSEAPEIQSLGEPASVKASRQQSPKKEGPISNRRLLADQDYARLKESGPPKDARCALCHEPQDPAANGVYRLEQAGEDVDFSVLDRCEGGLGPFILVRASAIMNAWIHLQCALWSPEVYVTTGGDVERAGDATRRGRMIKCKTCGQKGATLGCHKRSCRASYHLNCAREHGCLLQGVGEESYLVTCRGHSKIRSHYDLVEQMPVMPDQRISPDGPAPRSHSQPPRRESLSKTHSGPPAGWNHSSSPMDALTAAAVAAEEADMVAVNPMAAQQLGGTVGQSSLRPGRCSVCIIQRKGVCGTITAPKKCLRRMALANSGQEVPPPPSGVKARRNWSSTRARGSSPPEDSATAGASGSKLAREESNATDAAIQAVLDLAAKERASAEGTKIEELSEAGDGEADGTVGDRDTSMEPESGALAEGGLSSQEDAPMGGD